jgi:hypothetical protein
MSEKTDETFGTHTCNICVLPLQHMQHPDLLLQYPYEQLQHTSETSETVETYTCNMRFQQTLADGWPGGALHSGIQR